MMTAINLDLWCAKHGAQLANNTLEAILAEKQKKTKEPISPEAQAKLKESAAKTAENLITRMLGVLQSQGIYALFLLLSARKDVGGKELGEELIAIIEESLAIKLGSYEAILDKLKREDGILANLSQLLLAKRVMERTLVYARYHAKAEGGNG